jgi:hypothetical protein
MCCIHGNLDIQSQGNGTVLVLDFHNQNRHNRLRWSAPSAERRSILVALPKLGTYQSCFFGMMGSGIHQISWSDRNKVYEQRVHREGCIPSSVRSELIPCKAGNPLHSLDDIYTCEMIEMTTESIHCKHHNENDLQVCQLDRDRNHCNERSLFLSKCYKRNRSFD